MYGHRRHLCSTAVWPACCLLQNPRLKCTFTDDRSRTDINNGCVSLLRDCGKCSLVVKASKLIELYSICGIREKKTTTARLI